MRRSSSFCGVFNGVAKTIGGMNMLMIDVFTQFDSNARGNIHTVCEFRPLGEVEFFSLNG